MSWNEHAIAFAFSVPIGLATSVIAYTLIGVSGYAWASEALNFVLYATIPINFFGYFFLLFHVSKIRLFGNIAFSFLIFLGFLYANLRCFPGTGNRYDNCGSEVFVYIGVANFLTIILFNLARSQWIILASFLSFPYVTYEAYNYLSDPFWLEMNSSNLSETCFLQKSALSKFENAKRIKSLNDINLGVFIGEHSPRVYKLSNNKISVWQYSRRQFGNTYYSTEVASKICNKYIVNSD